ncbi:MAG: NAD(P)H-hydrate dehydratase [Dehalococcoidia bacterium]|nr:NAD(P)H-hydrate dehydratase [Dehalococcoidia bacterium]
MKVFTVEGMRELDRRATEEFGLSPDILMENAGIAVYEVAKAEFGISGRRFTVLCGGGNNGGDGLVAARKLNSMGADVRVYLLAAEDSLRGPVRRNCDAVVKAGILLEQLSAGDDLYLGRQHDVIIDAIFGTGLSRGPEGLYREIIECVNASDSPVLSVDIPSGVNGNTGRVESVAVRATCTVTFGAPKQGNLLPPGRELSGKLFVSRISFPPPLYGGASDVVANRLSPLPPRPVECHKGDFGDVLFVSGTRTYMGAPFFTSMSFMKAGGGYARLATPSSISPLLFMRASEAVMVPLRETVDGNIALSNLDDLRTLSTRADMVVVGPGVSLNAESQELVRQLVSQIAVPVLIDGDGLTAVAEDVAGVAGRDAPTILTPHVGEMARLLGTSTEEIEKDRIEAVREAAKRFNAVVLLKGSSTLVSGPEGLVSVNLSGNPGMATAGSGDVLSGTIAAVQSLGLGVREAAEVGAFIHGLAGDLAAAVKGQDGVIASDMMEYLSSAIDQYRERFDEMRRNFYGRLVVI